jgi:haloacetate dehalogenase
MFDGFTSELIDTGEAILRVRYGGSGPPVLLLHGHPRTHATWHRVAALLAHDHTVICPDLRGYGQSSKPPTTTDHAPYSKRVMARDMVVLMQGLGHNRFAVVGHDRGAYVALRLTLDHPDLVKQLVIMEAVPIAEALDRCDARFAASWWHWFFFGQTAKPAERVINADPDAWYAVDRGPMGEEAYADLRAALHDPQVVHAMCEDYRAGLGIDRAHEDADRAAGNVLRCPTFVIWATGDDLPDLYGDVLAVWRPWASNLRGATVDCGHHIAEERPEELVALLRDFFAG